MFDLEQCIAQWRQQMLAVGVKAPVPLDELEAHLREEIQDRIKSGCNEAEAFRAAVQEIGQRETLAGEFKKIEKNDPAETAMNSLIQIIGWVAACWILLWGYWMLELAWNLGGFDLKWSVSAFYAICEILIAGTGTWFLAKASRDRISGVVSLLVCLFLGWLAFVTYRHQMHYNWIGGRAPEPSPFWYRGSTTLVFLMPGVFWIWRRLPARHKKYRPTTPAVLAVERIFSVTAAFYIIFVSIAFLRMRDGARFLFALVAVLLAVLLIIYAGFLTYNGWGTLKQARH